MITFDRFVNHFEKPYDVNRESQLTNGFTCSNSELSALFELLGGSSYGNGIYKIFSSSQITAWNLTITDAFPIYNEVIPFGYDWLGRIFACKTSKQIIRLDPGVGDVINIPTSIVDFHNIELVDYTNDALSSLFYNDWLQAGGTHPAILSCIGYKVPLFLGGTDKVENLENIDLDVYWSFNGQMLQKISLNEKISKNI